MPTYRQCEDCWKRHPPYRNCDWVRPANRAEQRLPAWCYGDGLPRPRYPRGNYCTCGHMLSFDHRGEKRLCLFSMFRPENTNVPYEVCDCEGARLPRGRSTIGLNKKHLT